MISFALELNSLKLNHIVATIDRNTLAWENFREQSGAILANTSTPQAPKCDMQISPYKTSPRVLKWPKICPPKRYKFYE